MQVHQNLRRRIELLNMQKEGYDMSAPSDYEKRVVAMVDPFIKTVVRTKHFMLKPVRLSAECYDKHFAIFIRVMVFKF